MKRLPLGLKSRFQFALFLSALFGLGSVGILAHAEDIGVAESTENTFRPDRILGVTIGDDPRQASRIDKISWNTDEIKVVTRYFGSSSESFLIIDGILKKDDPKKWHLVWGEKSKNLRSDGGFRFEIPFNSRLASLDLVAVGPKGETEYHFYSINLIYPKTEVLVKKPTDELAEDIEFNAKLKKRFFVSPGFGVSSLTYTQTDLPVYRSIVTTAKVSANYLIVPPKWDIGFTGFLNFLSLSKNSAVDVRFLGLNLRVGYIFPEVKAPWRLSLYGGWYYSTMFASDSSFGYKNVSGPQLFPVLRRNLGTGHAFSTYFKFSPISSSLGILSLSNREVATGIAYLIPTPNHTYGISLDYAQITLSDPELSIRSSSLSLGGSMTF